MRRSTILLAASGLLASACSRPPDLPAFDGVDALLRDAVRDGAVTGVVAQVSTPSGVIYEGAFGESDPGRGAPMAADSIFRIASMTKAVTSVAVMQLVERGEVGLDDPAGEHLEKLRDVNVLVGFANGTGGPVYRPPASAPTVRQLLTHTSGFGYAMFQPDLARLVSEHGLAGILEGTDGFLEAPLLADPGTEWIYGIGTDWLAELVEQVSGLEREEYFRRQIFEPLAMVDTGYDVPVEKRSRLVAISRREADGTLTGSREPPRERAYKGGGHGLFSTVVDYGRFVRMILNGGELEGRRILERRTVEQMADNQIGRLEAGRVASPVPGFSRPFDFFPRTGAGFGLGFLINRKAVDGGRAAGSLTWAGIYNTFFLIDHESGVAAILLMQSLPFCDEPVADLWRAFEREAYAAAGASTALPYRAP